MAKTFIAVSDGEKLICDTDIFKRSLRIRKGKKYRIEEIESKRSGQQNRSLHLYFNLLADEFNNAGYSVQIVLKEKIDLDWTTEMVKDLLWRPAQEAILKKKSTTELKKTEDIDKVWEHLNRHISQKFGIHVPFPHQDEPDIYYHK